MRSWRWGVLAYVYVAELRKSECIGLCERSKSVSDEDNNMSTLVMALKEIKHAGFLHEYIGYILQKDYDINLVQLLLKAAELGVYDKIIFYVKTNLVFEKVFEAEQVEAFVDAYVENEADGKYITVLSYYAKLLRLLEKYGKRQDMRVLVQQLAFRLVRAYRENRWYPTGTDSFEDAARMVFGLETEEYQVSGLWGVLLEWLIILEMKEEYEAIREFLTEELGAVTKCIWFLRQEEEALFYDAFAMNLAGEGVSVHVEKNFEELSKKMHFIWKQYEKEVFSYEQYCFPALEMMVCRYYGYIPR